MLSAVFADLASESKLFCVSWFQAAFCISATAFLLGLYMTAGLFSHWVWLPSTVAERVRAETEGRLSRARRGFKAQLAIFDREGIVLVGKKASKSDVDKWVQRLVQYVALAVGEGEAQRVVSNAGFTAFSIIPGMDQSVATNLSYRRARIAELIARADELSFEESFDPH